MDISNNEISNAGIKRIPRRRGTLRILLPVAVLAAGVVVAGWFMETDPRRNRAPMGPVQPW